MDLKIEDGFEFIIKTLNDLPDSSGILRCMMFADLMRVTGMLHEKVKKQMEADKEEKLILEARIRDLEQDRKEQ